MANSYPVLNATEHAISFENHGQRLWGMLHLPHGDGPHPAVMLLHGLTGSRIESHRFFVHLSRALAAQGIAALRFDFRGSGDSEGEFQEMTAPGELSDAKAGLDWMVAHPALDSARLGVAGVSLGGMIAAQLAGRNPSLLRAAALLAALADPALFASAAQQTANQSGESPLEALARDGYFLLWGYPLGMGFVQTIFEQQPVEDVKRFRGRVLIVHGTEDPTVPVQHAELYKDALGERATLHKLNSKTHVFDEPPVERQAIDLIVSWFKEMLR
ncbi:MAG: alpha/beta fold hydrolase [Anaerolineae bacterium]|nr:alpha/beta fold hydrolase [Thermoflexales bacterium]MDW8407033.1 alpha/beta fold hydrolase [Anaerolineae bacterium]